MASSKNNLPVTLRSDFRVLRKHLLLSLIGLLASLPNPAAYLSVLPSSFGSHVLLSNVRQEESRMICVPKHAFFNSGESLAFSPLPRI